jgi:serine/threonine protein kinase
MNLASVIGETIDDKYLVERQLGKGGMGAVFLATHVGTGRNVAVKIIMPQFMAQDEFIERFRREARAAGRLRHPNVVDVTDFGFAQVGKERVAYLVMEYLDGCTLDEVLEEEERLPVSWVVDILEQTCSAVDEAHQQGIIHRDLKPDNIWLEPNRRGGYTVKVLDFGIAKLEEGSGQGEEPAHDPSARTLIGKPLNPTANPPRVVSEYAATLITGTDNAGATNIDNGQEGHAAAARARVMPTEFSEGDTLLNPVPAAAPTVADVNEAEGATKLFGTKYTDERDTFSTSAHSSLTRVGALLGTPLYMSPEQCHGKPLDARTDVYSLGVIAYRMLSGNTPFTGNPTVVMQQHKEAAPPPLVARKASKKLRRVVMSALAKDPADRPANPAAFANTMRSYSEGVGQLVQAGLMLYLQHIRSFLRLDLLVYSPVIFITIAQSVVAFLHIRGQISTMAQAIMAGVIGLLTFPLQIVSAYTVTGTTTWMVTQLLGAPLRPLRVRESFAALGRRLGPFLFSILLISGFTIATLIPPIVAVVLAKLINRWLVLLVLPAFIPMVALFVGTALAIPSVMMEKITGFAALRRSLQLTARSKRTVIATLAIHFLIPILLAACSRYILGRIFKSYELANGDELANMLFPLVWLPAQILMGGMVAVITGLLYLKTRQAGGETVRELLRDLGASDRPQTRWQQRMRERLTASSRTTH